MQCQEIPWFAANRFVLRHQTFHESVFLFFVVLVTTYITESSVVVADLLFKAFNVADNLVEIEELLRHFSILFEKKSKRKIVERVLLCY